MKYSKLINNNCTEKNGLGKITIFIVTVGQTQIIIKYTTIYSKNSYILSNFYFVYVAIFTINCSKFYDNNSSLSQISCRISLVIFLSVIKQWFD